MNERLKELYKQAIDYAYTDANPYNGCKNGKDFNENVNEKFAELIVKECARIAEESDDSWSGAGPEAAAQIKQYFGVNK